MSAIDPDSTTPGFATAVQEEATCAGFLTGIEAKLDAADAAISDPLLQSEADPPNDAGDPLIGSRIGDFLIESLIASGGMGCVYKAVQLEPVKRQVALKLIRRGLSDDTTVNRFFAERQMLALMDHPDIARVYDAGTSQAGQPFFTMEFCDGQPIEEYCDQRSLNLEERIKLVIRIARAVQRAHSHGVIHRDLKPGNVLVADCEGRPNLKVIDFGIAKFCGNDESGQFVDIKFAGATQQDVMIGTPAFMSPEQAAGATIDARTDVFSIGAILFKLLTGTPPIPQPGEGCDSVSSLILHIQSFEPIPPTKRIAEFDNDKALSQAQRLGITNRSKLVSALKGDLDWIALRAIEPNRTRRYASADDLADDLERYLRKEPVIAAAPSRWYRWKKFYQRRRATVLAIAAVFATLFLSAFWVGITEWKEQRQLLEEQLQVQDESETLVKLAEDARRRAGRGGPTSQDDLIAAQTAIAKVETLIEEHPELEQLHQKLHASQAAIRRDREAMELIPELNAAREQATLIDTEYLGDVFGKQAGIQKLVRAFSDYGVHPLRTSPDDAARVFSQCPKSVIPEIIGALDFIVHETPVGVGLYLHEQDGRITVAELVPGGAADAAGLLQPGDRLLSIDGIDLVLDLLADKIRSETYRCLTRRPGTPVKITYVRGLDKPEQGELICRGDLAFWAVEVLDRLDQNSWRNQLRAATLEVSIDALYELSDQPEAADQPPMSLIQLASSLYHFERAPEYIAILVAAQQKHPEDFWANHYLGTALATTVEPIQTEASLRYLTAAVALRPNSIGARLNLIQALERCGELETARKQATALLKMAPKDASWIQNLSQRLALDESAPLTSNFSNDRKTNQLSRQQSALHLANDLNKVEWQARQFALNGDRDQAIRIINLAREQFGETPAIRRMQGVVLLDLQDYSSARIALSDAARLAPTDAAARFYYGVALQYSGNSAGAIHEYQAALDLRPDYLAVHEFLDPLLEHEQ